MLLHQPYKCNKYNETATAALDDQSNFAYLPVYLSSNLPKFNYAASWRLLKLLRKEWRQKHFPQNFQNGRGPNRFYPVFDIIRLFESGEEEQICFIVKCDPSCSINNDALLEAIQKNKSDFKLNTKDRKLKTGVSRTTLQYWAHPSHFSLWSTVGDSGNCWLIEFRKSKRLFYHPFQLIRDDEPRGPLPAAVRPQPGFVKNTDVLISNVGNSEYEIKSKQLDKWAREGTSNVVIVQGHQPCGKSAIVYEWAKRISKKALVLWWNYTHRSSFSCFAEFCRAHTGIEFDPESAKHKLALASIQSLYPLLYAPNVFFVIDDMNALDNLLEAAAWQAFIFECSIPKTSNQLSKLIITTRNASNLPNTSRCEIITLHPSQETNSPVNAPHSPVFPLLLPPLPNPVHHLDTVHSLDHPQPAHAALTPLGEIHDPSFMGAGSSSSSSMYLPIYATQPMQSMQAIQAMQSMQSMQTTSTMSGGDKGSPEHRQLSAIFESFFEGTDSNR